MHRRQRAERRPREQHSLLQQALEVGQQCRAHARRIAWRGHFALGAYASDITLANWPQMGSEVLL